MAEKIIVAGMIEGKGYDTNLEYNRRVYATKGVAPACKGMGGGGHETKIADPNAYDEQNGYLRKDGTVGSLTTAGSSPKHNNRAVETSFRIRKLTPRECFRLMDFDDADFVKAKYKLINDDETAQWFLGQEKKLHARTMKREEWKKFYVYLRKKHERVSETQLYKQAGNSIVVAVLEAIFREML